MYGPKDQVELINWSRGIDTYNAQASDLDGVPKPSRPYTRKEQMSGFMDDLCNLRITQDGRLTTRDRLIAAAGLASGDYPNSASGRSHIMISGRYSYFTTDNVACALYMIRTSTTNRVFQPITCDSSGSGAVATGTRRNITTVSSATGLTAVYYNGLWYVYRDDSTAAFSFANTGGIVNALTITGLPTGKPSFGAGLGNALVWKDRVFAFDGNTIYYSKATDPTIFASPDGGNFQLSTKAAIVDTIVHQDALWILDGENKLWLFDFNTDPGVDGFLRQVTQAGDLIGKQFQSGSLAVTQGRLFVASTASVYEVINENLVDIGEQLHLMMNRHDQVTIINLDHSILVQGFSFNGSTESHVIQYVYDLNQGTWVRYRFDLFNSSVSDRSVVINGNCPIISDALGSVVVMPFDSLRSDTPVGSDFCPLMGLLTTTFWDTSTHADQFLSVFDGNGATRVSRTIYQRIATGVLYYGPRDFFKKFKFFVLDAYLGWRKEGDETLNKTPFKTTVSFVPTSAASLVSSTSVQKVHETEQASYPYRIAANKLARGVQFVIETEDIVTVPNTEDVDTSTSHLVSRDVFDRLSIIYNVRSSSRNVSGSNAFADSGSQ